MIIFGRWNIPHERDPNFRMIAVEGRLVETLANWRKIISLEAGDLLQKMLRMDPSSRLSLLEVMDHRWVVNNSTSQNFLQVDLPIEPRINRIHRGEL